MPTEADSSLMLEILKSVQEGIARLEHGQREHNMRLARIEVGLASVRRDAAGDAESLAHAHARIDRLQDQLTRINTRLGLIEG